MSSHILNMDGSSVKTTSQEYKIILLGDLGVGKTTLFLRIKCKAFVDTTIDTTYLGCDEASFDYTVEGTPVKVRLHDTGGSERFRTLTNNYYRNADAAILCYDLETLSTFQNLYDWYEMASGAVHRDELVWAIVGNKSDASDQEIEVEPQTVELLRAHVCTDLVFVASSKTNDGIDNMLEKIITTIHNKRLGRITKRSSVRIRPKTKSSCC